VISEKGEKSAKCKEDIHAEVSTKCRVYSTVYTRLKDSAKVPIKDTQEEDSGQ